MTLQQPPVTTLPTTTPSGRHSLILPMTWPPDGVRLRVFSLPGRDSSARPGRLLGELLRRLPSCAPVSGHKRGHPSSIPVVCLLCSPRGRLCLLCTTARCVLPSTLLHIWCNFAGYPSWWSGGPSPFHLQICGDKYTTQACRRASTTFGLPNNGHVVHTLWHPAQLLGTWSREQCQRPSARR